jgi:translation initiation factor IF-3
VNHQIRIPQIRLIDQDGKQVGIVETRKAMEMAETLTLDLVEVAPNSRPPVCRIMDYGKYKYEQSKKLRKRKQHASKLKEVKLGLRTGEHDYQFLLRHAESFLQERNKVKLSITFRGRENAHREFGAEVMKRAQKDLEHVGVPEGPVRQEGRDMVLMLAPK